MSTTSNESPEPAETAADDIALLVRWRGGDQRAGQAIVERHAPALSAFLVPRAGAHASDLLQLTLLALLQGKTSPSEIRSVRAYLFGVARNQYLMWQRRLATERKGERVLLETPKSSVTTPSERYAKGALRETVVSCLRELPEHYETTLELHYWQGLSVKEIAAVMETREGTVKARLARGRAMLEERLRKAGVEV